MVPLSLQRGKYVISFFFPLFKQSGINYPPTSSVPLSLQNGKRFACFTSRQHTRINFPPDKLLWQSADNQMVQAIRPCGHSPFLSGKDLRFAFFLFSIFSFYKRISFKSGLTVMHNKKPSELFVLKVFVVAEWKGFEPLRGYKPT